MKIRTYKGQTVALIDRFHESHGVDKVVPVCRIQPIELDPENTTATEKWKFCGQQSIVSASEVYHRDGREVVAFHPRIKKSRKIRKD